MGFVFNLFVAFVAVPVTLIFLVAWLITKKRLFAISVGLLWLAIVGIGILVTGIHWLTSKKVLKKRDYYGTFVVDRDYFKGAQADWQYNSFRFEIKKNDSIFFYVTDKEKVIQTYRGIISTNPLYASERLILEMQQPTHHIVSSNPTTFRNTWSFYLVFHSPKFNNVFFKKGKWRPISSD